MKKPILLFFACTLIFTAYSQSVPGKWMIKKIGISLGQDLDMIQKMDAEYMMNTGRITENSVFRNQDFSPETLYGGVCENPYIRAYLTLGAPGNNRFNLDLAMIGVFNRYDGLSYYQYQNGGSDYLSISSLSNEISLESTLNRQLNIARWLKLYGGVGTNLGYNFGGYLYFDGVTQEQVDQTASRSTADIFSGETYLESQDAYEVYKLRHGFSQRIFGTAGLGIVIARRAEVGLFLTRGIGYRNNFGAGTKMIKLHSFGLRANWILNQDCCSAK